MYSQQFDLMSFISVLKVRQKKALLDTDSGWKKTILLWVTTSKQRLNVRLNGRWGRCRLFLHIEEVSGGNSSLAEKRRTSLTHTSRYIHTSTHANTHQQADGRFRRCSARQHQAGLYLRTQRDTQSASSSSFRAQTWNDASCFVVCGAHPPAAPGWRRLLCSRGWPCLLCSTWRST